ncbi:M4 family metallopeptidase [Longispora urticae]
MRRAIPLVLALVAALLIAPGTARATPAAGVGHGYHYDNTTLGVDYVGATYYLRDPLRGNTRTTDCMTQQVIGSATSSFGTRNPADIRTVAADVHYVLGQFWDYYKVNHARSGILNNGAGTVACVRMSTTNRVYRNGSQFVVESASSGGLPLDLLAHELVHAVTEAMIGLGVSGESGALNESTSDVFGTLIEFGAAHPADPPDYTEGERTGTVYHYLYNPGLDGYSDTCWSTLTAGHPPFQGSGVGNHAFFALAEGTGVTPYGTSPVCAGAPAVTGIGRATAGRIWYRALNYYLTSSANYRTTRTGTLAAAADLYGKCSVEHRAVRASWVAVGVPGTDVACP